VCGRGQRYPYISYRGPQIQQGKSVLYGGKPQRCGGGKYEAVKRLLEIIAPVGADPDRDKLEEFLQRSDQEKTHGNRPAYSLLNQGGPCKPLENCCRDSANTAQQEDTDHARERTIAAGPSQPEIGEPCQARNNAQNYVCLVQIITSQLTLSRGHRITRNRENAKPTGAPPPRGRDVSSSLPHVRQPVPWPVRTASEELSFGASLSGPTDGEALPEYALYLSTLCLQ